MKVSIPCFIHASHSSYTGKVEYDINSFDRTPYDTSVALVREQIIEVDIPDGYDPRPQQVESLRAEKAKILAKAQAEATQIDERISKLLALEDRS